MSDLRVLVVDDHPGFRAGMAALLAREPGLTVVGEAADGAEAVEAAVALRPDVVLMDLDMPGTDGIAATRRLAIEVPEARVLVLTMFREDASVFAAMRAGARGYVLKESEVPAVVAAIRAVAAHEAIFGPGVAERVLRHLAGDGLPRGERQVLDLLAAGTGVQDVPAQLGVSGEEVRERVTGVLSKLRDEGDRPAVPDHVRLHGELAVVLGGVEVHQEVQGSQQRLVLAYLVLQRRRGPVPRYELGGVLWPERPPADASGALSAVLSKLRRAVGAERLAGRSTVELVLEPGVEVDTELAERAVADAETALAARRPADATARAQAALDVLSAELLPGLDGPWVAARRRDAEELRLRALQTACRAALEGDADPAAAQVHARELVRAAPFRESGHVLLMRALAAAGEAADALRAYEALRVRLRDELGTVPGSEAQELHRRLLAGHV